MNPITFPDRSKLIEELLLGLDKRPVDREVADIIYGHFKNKSHYYIEYQEWDDPRSSNPQSIILERPNLWRFDSYQASSNQWKSIRNYSEQERIRGWIEQANIKMVAYVIKTQQSLDDNMSLIVATRLVKRNMWQNIRALGCSKRITREDEL